MAVAHSPTPPQPWGGRPPGKRQPLTCGRAAVQFILLHAGPAALPRWPQQLLPLALRKRSGSHRCHPGPAPPPAQAFLQSTLSLLSLSAFWTAPPPGTAPSILTLALITPAHSKYRVPPLPHAVPPRPFCTRGWLAGKAKRQMAWIQSLRSAAGAASRYRRSLVSRKKALVSRGLLASPPASATRRQSLRRITLLAASPRRGFSGPSWSSSRAKAQSDSPYSTAPNRRHF